MANAGNPDIADPPNSFRSAVWQHFGYSVEIKDGSRVMDKTQTICLKCFKKLPQVTGNTSRMQMQAPSRRQFKWSKEAPVTTVYSP